MVMKKRREKNCFVFYGNTPLVFIASATLVSAPAYKQPF